MPSAPSRSAVVRLADGVGVGAHPQARAPRRPRPAASRARRAARPGGCRPRRGRRAPVRPSTVTCRPRAGCAAGADGARRPGRSAGSATPQTAGVPAPRATTAACEASPPEVVTTALGGQQRRARRPAWSRLETRTVGDAAGGELQGPLGGQGDQAAGRAGRGRPGPVASSASSPVSRSCGVEQLLDDLRPHRAQRRGRGRSCRRWPGRPRAGGAARGLGRSSAAALSSESLPSRSSKVTWATSRRWCSRVASVCLSRSVPPGSAVSGSPDVGAAAARRCGARPRWNVPVGCSAPVSGSRLVAVPMPLRSHGPMCSGLHVQGEAEVVGQALRAAGPAAARRSPSAEQRGRAERELLGRVLGDGARRPSPRTAPAAPRPARRAASHPPARLRGRPGDTPARPRRRAAGPTPRSRRGRPRGRSGRSAPGRSRRQADPGHLRAAARWLRSERSARAAAASVRRPRPTRRPTSSSIRSTA